jgi:aryl-alcohol dehydrogenase-like predicted oxidoreductase
MFAMRGLLGWRMDELRKIQADAAISSLSELAYRYARHEGRVNVILTGTGNPEHLKRNIAAALAPPLPDAALKQLQELRLSDLQAARASTR